MYLQPDILSMKHIASNGYAHSAPEFVRFHTLDSMLAVASLKQAGPRILCLLLAYSNTCSSNSHGEWCHSRADHGSTLPQLPIFLAGFFCLR